MSVIPTIKQVSKINISELEESIKDDKDKIATKETQKNYQNETMLAIDNIIIKMKI